MIRVFLIALLSFVCVSTVTATPFTFDDIVDSHDNLFFTDWGHWYTEPVDAALNAAGSNPARAARFAGNSFDFAAYDTLQITAKGSVQAHGAVATGPDGCGGKPECALHDGDFRLLPMYGLIGIWSSSATQIVPFGTWHDLNSGLGLLFIGSFAQLTIPDFPAAYLFLAENDGGFSDNSGFFDVHFVADVPEPGTFGLLCAGMIGMALLRNRRRARVA
jgi:hypothetical protein